MAKQCINLMQLKRSYSFLCMTAFGNRRLLLPFVFSLRVGRVRKREDDSAIKGNLPPLLKSITSCICLDSEC